MALLAMSSLVLSTVNILQAGRSVLVHCFAGKSRSAGGEAGLQGKRDLRCLQLSLQLGYARVPVCVFKMLIG